MNAVFFYLRPMPKSSDIPSYRQTFAPIYDAVNIPNLIEVQRTSYTWFMSDGLKELFE